MKLLFLILFSSSICFASGSAVGTMSSIAEVQKSGSNVQDIYKYTEESKIPEIVLYKGETAKDLFIQYGKNKGNDWQVSGFKIDKILHNVNEAYIDAILKSKLSNNWEIVVPVETFKIK